MYPIQYGTIFVIDKQNYLAHVSFINERRKLPLTTPRNSQSQWRGWGNVKKIVHASTATLYYYYLGYDWFDIDTQSLFAFLLIY